MRNLLEQTFPKATLSTWSHFDADGLVMGTPCNVGVDLVDCNGTQFMLGVQNTLGLKEIATFLKVGRLYTRAHPDSALCTRN